MNTLSDWLSQPVAHRLGWALVHSLWQGVLAAALFGLLRIVLRRHSARARYVAGCFVLLAVALAPAVTFLTMSGQARGSAGTGLHLERGQSFLETPAFFSALDFGRTAPGPLARAFEILEWLLPWLVAGWTIGVK